MKFKLNKSFHKLGLSMAFKTYLNVFNGKFPLNTKYCHRSKLRNFKYFKNII